MKRGTEGEGCRLSLETPNNAPFISHSSTLFCAGACDSEKAIYEDIDDECLEPPEWSSTRKREKTRRGPPNARQSCGTLSDDSEQWNEYEAPCSDEDVVDVEATDFDATSEDSSKLSEA